MYLFRASGRKLNKKIAKYIRFLKSSELNFHSWKTQTMSNKELTVPDFSDLIQPKLSW